MNRLSMKVTIILLIAIIGVSSTSINSGYANSIIRVTYNDQPIHFNINPVMKNGTTYVETRPFIQPFGFHVEWVNKTKLTLSKSDLMIELELNNSVAYINSKKTILSAAPIKIGATLFLPLRAITGITGHKVNWNSATNTITIQPTDSDYKIIAYYTSWGTYQNINIAQIDASKLTHINYAFANIKEGQIVPGDPWVDTQKPFPGDCTRAGCLKGNFNQLIKLKKANPHLRTLISVGGWTWSNHFSDAALTASSRTRFADSAVKFIRDYGFDGVDLDWEYPVSGGLPHNINRTADKQNFTLLLREMRNKLNIAQQQDGKTYLLTIASGAFPGYVKNTEMVQVAEQLDWINLMTYDFHGDWESVSNHHAPLFTDPNDPITSNSKANINSAVYTYLLEGVPANKLMLGIPLSGRSWTSCNSSNLGLYQSCSGGTSDAQVDSILEYNQLEDENLINGNGYVRYWSSAAKVPWLYNKSTRTFITYEDPESISYKAKYIKDKGLGGAFLWEIGYDLNHTLQNKLYQSMK